MKADEKTYAKKRFILKNAKIKRAKITGKEYIKIAKELQRVSFLL